MPWRRQALSLTARWSSAIARRRGMQILRAIWDQYSPSWRQPRCAYRQLNTLLPVHPPVTLRDWEMTVETVGPTQSLGRVMAVVARLCTAHPGKAFQTLSSELSTSWENQDLWHLHRLLRRWMDQGLNRGRMLSLTPRWRSRLWSDQQHASLRRSLSRSRPLHSKLPQPPLAMRFPATERSAYKPATERPACKLAAVLEAHLRTVRLLAVIPARRRPGAERQSLRLGPSCHRRLRRLRLEGPHLHHRFPSLPQRDAGRPSSPLFSRHSPSSCYKWKAILVEFKSISLGSGSRHVRRFSSHIG
jgi:hypothetical protein